MIKYFTPLLISLTVIFGFSSSEVLNRNSSFAPEIPVMSTPNKSDSLGLMNLDKTKICQPCPPGVRPLINPECVYNVLIKVSINELKNENSIYRYSVSGGRIIGEGANVIWDMTNAMPGTYQIKVDIEDNKKKQKRTEIKQIENFDGGCVWDCFCPTLSVTASDYTINASETVTFTANVSGSSGEKVTYNWTVSDGKIIEGQGTPVIRVSTDSKMAGKTIEATIEIGGVCEECNKTESASVSIVKAKKR